MYSPPRHHSSLEHVLYIQRVAICTSSLVFLGDWELRARHTKPPNVHSTFPAPFYSSPPPLPKLFTYILNVFYRFQVYKLWSTNYIELSLCQTTQNPMSSTGVHVPRTIGSSPIRPLRLAMILLTHLTHGPLF